MKKQYLECGKIVSTHGVRGEIKVQPWCDSPDFLTYFKTLYLNGAETPVCVEKAKVHKNMAILKLAGWESLEEAASLRGKILFINRDDAPAVADGEYYIQDLLGIQVFDADSGYFWGSLTDVISTGANDVYEITAENGKKRLIPVIPQVVLRTSLEENRMLIRPLKGLFDDED